MHKINLKSLILDCVLIEEGWKDIENTYIKTGKISEEDTLKLSKWDPSNSQYFTQKADIKGAPNQYLTALVKWYSQGQFDFNNSHVQDVLTLYDRIKKQGKLKPQHKDINIFRRFEGLSEIVDEYLKESGEDQSTKSEEDVSIKNDPNINLIFNENGWQVWATKTYESTHNFIKVLYDQTNEDASGYGTSNFKKGKCPYCTVSKHHFDSYASRFNQEYDKPKEEYTQYWILTNKKEPYIIRGEGIEKVEAMLDNYNTNDEPQFLDKYDDSINQFKDLDPMLKKIFTNIVIKDETYLPDQLYSDAPDGLKHKYIDMVISKGWGLSDPQYSDTPDYLKRIYVKLVISTESWEISLTGQQYSDIPDTPDTPNGLKHKYIDMLISNGLKLSAQQYSDAPNDVKRKYFEERIFRGRDISLSDQQYSDTPKYLKRKYIDKSISEGLEISDQQYSDIPDIPDTPDTPDDLKRKYIDMVISKGWVLSDQKYSHTPDDLKRKYFEKGGVDGRVLSAQQYSDTPKYLKRKYIEKRISVGWGLTDPQYSDTPDDLKRKYIEKRGFNGLSNDMKKDAIRLGLVKNEVYTSKINLKSLILETLYIKDLNTINPNKYKYRFDEIERNNFSSYFASDSETVISDWSEPGFMGFGVFDDDNNDIKGYLYGYAFSQDELEDIEDLLDSSEIKIYDNSFKNIELDIKTIPKIFNSKTTFYVDNFVIDNDYRKQFGHTREYYNTLTSLINGFFDKIKSRGYTYIAFSGLSDTSKFLINPKSGALRQSNGNAKLSIKIGSGEPIFVLKLIK